MSPRPSTLNCSVCGSLNVKHVDAHWRCHRCGAQSDDGVEARAAAVLVAHQRHTIGACGCGWVELGKSHTRHVVQQLEQAGVLKASGASS